MSLPQEQTLHVVESPEKFPDPADVLPPDLVIDSGDSPDDVIDALALAPFATGRQPWARAANIERVKADAPLRPAGSRLLRSWIGEGSSQLLAGGEGWTLRAVRWRGGSARVEVTAIDDELAKSVLAESVRDAAAPPPPPETHVEMGFWHLSVHGAVRKEREITAEPWAEIRANYSGAVAAALDEVMALTPAEVSGRLLLLHGPPGTGKTTALRSLAREWLSWCQVDCVLDPEVLFTSPGYLMEVAVGEENGGDQSNKRRWRLLILEDCDELIRGDAKSSTGQALSRLLNLTDGMLGQGRDVLVAITTNEDIARLHPAVVRPGRCLAQIEVGPLSRTEAAGWLHGAGVETSDGAVGPEGATLAELVALRKGERHATAHRQQAPSTTGFYL